MRLYHKDTGMNTRPDCLRFLNLIRGNTEAFRDIDGAHISRIEDEAEGSGESRGSEPQRRNPSAPGGGRGCVHPEAKEE